MNRSSIPILFLLGASLAACGRELPSPAELILHGGHLVTLSPEWEGATATAIKDGRITYVGDDAGALALASDSTELIDLDGRTVVPGFTDNHFHSIGGGPGVDLSGARRLAEVIDRLRERASGLPEGELVRTNGDWHEGQLEEQRLPMRDDLDQASLKHPIVVVRGGHELILNTAALQRFGIDERTPVPVGGSIGRYPDGRLNGELVDRAKDLVDLPVPAEIEDGEAAEAAALDALEQQHAALNRVGVTSVRYAGGGVEGYRRLRRLSSQGRLSLRVDYLLRLPASTEVDDVERVVNEWGVDPDDGDEWVRLGGVKLGVDGGFEGGWMSEPYLDSLGHTDEYFGLQTYPSDRYIETVQILHRLGYRVATHAVGDAAIDLVLEAYESANRMSPEEPIAPRRFSIEHGFVVRDDQLARIRALGVHVAAQHHLYVAAPSLAKYWGRERAERVTPVKTYVDAGIDVSLGTDAPVIPYPPQGVLYHFMTRDTLSAGVMGEAEKLERAQALSLMSKGYAKLTFTEDEAGAIAPGMRADLAVLDTDILSCAPGEIETMEVEATIVGGRVVFSRLKP